MTIEIGPQTAYVFMLIFARLGTMIMVPNLAPIHI